MAGRVQATEPVKAKWQKLSFYRRLEDSNGLVLPLGPPLLWEVVFVLEYVTHAAAPVVWFSWLLVVKCTPQMEMGGLGGAQCSTACVSPPLTDLILLIEAKRQVLC